VTGGTGGDTVRKLGEARRAHQVDVLQLPGT
jgi:hypothetical protein